MDEQELEAIDKARDILGEFFGNFAFCVVGEDGELFYDYRDRFVGKALFVAAVGGDVLRLPVTAEIDDGVTSLLPTTIESASLTSNVVSLILNDPAVAPGHSFQIGDEVTVEGVQFTTTDPNGVHTLTGVTDNGDTVTLTYALTGANETYVTAVVLPETLPFDLT